MWKNTKEENNNLKKVKITVLRKEFYSDFAEEYLTDGREAGTCSLLEVGDVFVFEGGAEMPEGFCPWAWIDIYRNVSAISQGATYSPWNRKENQTIVCCTDGIRPVVFHIEAINEN